MCNATDEKSRQKQAIIQCDGPKVEQLKSSSKKLTKRKKKKRKDVIIVELLNWHATMGVGAGLANLGNTCYLNSVLQCLTYTPALAQYLLATPLISAENEFSMLKVMKKHIQTTLLDKKKGQVVAPHPIVKNLKRIARHFRKFRQEDSHEFLRHVLDGMQQSILRDQRIKEHSDEASQTVMHQIFGGRFRSRVACGNCSYVSDTFQPFLDLSLEVSKNINSVKDALRHYSIVEVLDRSNAWKCSGCKRLSQAKKSLAIDSSPNVLILHLKRFDQFLGKINKPVQFTENLDINTFVASTDPNKRDLTYRLDAVLVHSGHSVHSGHYYAFVRAPNGQWFEVNDESVRWVSLSVVLKQQAYILFYSRVPKKKRKTTEASIVPRVNVSNEKQKIIEATAKVLSTQIPSKKRKTTDVVTPQPMVESTKMKPAPLKSTMAKVHIETPCNVSIPTQLKAMKYSSSSKQTISGTLLESKWNKNKFQKLVFEAKEKVDEHQSRIDKQQKKKSKSTPEKSVETTVVDERMDIDKLFAQRKTQIAQAKKEDNNRKNNKVSKWNSRADARRQKKNRKKEQKRKHCISKQGSKNSYQPSYKGGRRQW